LTAKRIGKKILKITGITIGLLAVFLVGFHFWFKAHAKEMLEASGIKDVRTYDEGYEVGMGIHEMGTARMGRDPKTSVLNGNNQVWDAPKVFVTDGACMTSASCVNPSLTYMALTARAAEFAVKEFK
jgi:choline dehydrogenase-like flavoprotein